MSSFTRKKGPTASDVATRPGPHGQRVVSTGLDDLDRILGGGLPLGSICVIGEDGWTSHHSTLLRYFVSEGAYSGQSLCILSPDKEAGSCSEETFGKEFMLKQISYQEAQKKDTASTASQDAQENVKLRIAWQYEKFLKKQEDAQPKAASSNKGSIKTRGSWCHVYDLTRPAAEESVRQVFSSQLRWYSSSNCTEGNDAKNKNNNNSKGSSNNNSTSGINNNNNNSGSSNNNNNSSNNINKRSTSPSVVSYLSSAVEAFINNLSEQDKEPTQNKSIGRVIIKSLGGVSYDSCGMVNVQALSRVLLQLKKRIQNTHVVVMATIPLHTIPEPERNRIQHIADAVFRLRSVEETSQVVRLSTDSKSVAGVLKVIKLPGFGGISSPAPQHITYVMRNKRRKIEISPIEIDADAEAEEAEQGATFGHGISMSACGPPATTQKLEF